MKALQHQNVSIGRYQVRSLMKEQGLKALQPRTFVPKTTNSKHTLGYAPNVLGQMGLPRSPDSVYVGDITYLPTTYGQWLYLNVWIDLFSRFVVGWKVADNMENSIAMDCGACSQIIDINDLYGVYRWNKGNPRAILTIRDDQTYVYEIAPDSGNVFTINGAWELNAAGSEIVMRDFMFRHSNDNELPRGNWL
jgi:hypothetical protein